MRLAYKLKYETCCSEYGNILPNIPQRLPDPFSVCFSSGSFQQSWIASIAYFSNSNNGKATRDFTCDSWMFDLMEETPGIFIRCYEMKREKVCRLGAITRSS